LLGCAPVSGKPGNLYLPLWSRVLAMAVQVSMDPASPRLGILSGKPMQPLVWQMTQFCVEVICSSVSVGPLFASEVVYLRWFSVDARSEKSNHTARAAAGPVCMCTATSAS
jgi:hypothetical protein